MQNKRYLTEFGYLRQTSVTVVNAKKPHPDTPKSIRQQDKTIFEQLQILDSTRLPSSIYVNDSTASKMDPKQTEHIAFSSLSIKHFFSNHHEVYRRKPKMPEHLYRVETPKKPLSNNPTNFKITQNIIHPPETSLNYTNSANSDVASKKKRQKN